MELTPELFEKIEFTERRKGYDTEQVETFLEEAGTALAQMLVRVRHTEERAAQAESRLGEAEQKLIQADEVLAEADRRVKLAEQRAEEALAQRSAAERLDEEAEVEQAARTLLIARRTADQTVEEAKAEARSVLAEARARAERQIADAAAESEEMLRRAAERAEAEFGERRAAALEDVRSLETRRSQLNDVIQQLESRLAGYREELTRAAEELLAVAEDPARLGARPTMSIPVDEVLESDEVRLGAATEDQADPAVGAAADEEPEQREDHPSDGATAIVGSAGKEHLNGAAAGEASAPEPDAEPLAAAEVNVEGPEAREGVATVDQDEQDEDPGERTQFLDLTGAEDGAEQVAGSDRWAPGSWSQIEAELDERVEVAEPVGSHRDRFLEELDSAVNEAVDLDDDAMKAFFEGSADSRARRFGWRR